MCQSTLFVEATVIRRAIPSLGQSCFDSGSSASITGDIYNMTKQDRIHARFSTQLAKIRWQKVRHSDQYSCTFGGCVRFDANGHSINALSGFQKPSCPANSNTGISIVSFIRLIDQRLIQYTRHARSKAKCHVSVRN